ncbi:MAG TPA: NAD(P)H-hydrate dehydratase [Thermoplasmata archaeon]|nr:NAD(P)H-hydrate dehydratase [Thermoplasmata archaeon]
MVLAPEEKLKTELVRNAFSSLKHLSKSEPNLAIFFINNLSRADLISLIDEADIIVDAMLGSGIRGALREPYRTTVETINTVVKGQNKKVVAIDVPTGWKGSVSIEPDLVVTFHDIKKGYQELAEKTEIADIGIPVEAEVFINKGHLLLLPELKKDTHKGMRGAVLVIGGGPFSGAPVLSALGASQSGIDLIHLAVPHKIFGAVISFSPDFIVHPLRKPEHIFSLSHLPDVLPTLKNMDALVLGPGLGRAQDTLQAVMKLLETEKGKGQWEFSKSIPCLLDADALFAIAENLPKFLKLRNKSKNLLLEPLVLTPHEGEFKRLLKRIKVSEEDIRSAYSGKEFNILGLSTELKEKIVETKLVARKIQAVILRKGPVDIITDGYKTRLNFSGTPAMAVGGTGDVLSGICGGLLAQGLAPLEASALGAYINGKAGELAFESKGRSMKATDVAAFIYKALKNV